MGTQVFNNVGTHTFNWPTGVNNIRVELWGGGGAGGGSQTTTFGGAGASACYVEGEFNRPSNGQSTVVVGAGGAAIVSNSASDGNSGGESSFHLGSDPNPNISSYGAGGGQPSNSIGAGGDGGAGGVYRGPDVTFFILGGQGQASMPNGGFPVGASAPRGACGGNNWQDGMQPGGGGAPGNSQLASGKGGDGLVVIRW